MDCIPKRRSKFLKIERSFSYSRLGADCLASAYETILPVIKHKIATPKPAELGQICSLSTKQAFCGKAGAISAKLQK